MTFEQLLDFITSRMRMSHVYQPVMLKTLLQNGGRCSEELVAKSLLAVDRSQIDYYQQITRSMVGRVLRSHGVVTRDAQTREYSLAGFSAFSSAETQALIAQCDEKLEGFLRARGDKPWGHRKQSSGYVSGTLRYEVLKAAKARCELCGISAEEKALEVDHIVPRSKQGSDDISNLQALCYSCNAMKRDRDDTDFRAVRASYEDREPTCVFCKLPDDRIIRRHELAVAIKDAYPVTEGHVLVIPRRHVASLFELGRPEVNACMSLLSDCQRSLRAENDDISGFNVGVNAGESAGQTVFHCHWHLIPRRHGDVENPRGGVRNTIPGRGEY